MNEEQLPFSNKIPEKNREKLTVLEDTDIDECEGIELRFGNARKERR